MQKLCAAMASGEFTDDLPCGDESAANSGRAMAVVVVCASHMGCLAPMVASAGYCPEPEFGPSRHTQHQGLERRGKHSLATSHALSANIESVDSLNVSWWCGCRPKARQMRETGVCVKPISRTMMRELQCVAPAGRSLSSFRTLGYVAWTRTAAGCSGCSRMKVLATLRMLSAQAFPTTSRSVPKNCLTKVLLT